jgi:hypothetical protein
MLRRNILIIIVAFFTATGGGCEKAAPAKYSPPIKTGQTEYVVAIAIDLSGSFYQMILDGDGKAYKFAMAVVEQLFHDRTDPNDRIVLCQISGTEKSLLWEGNPMDLKRDFSSAAAFRDFMMKRSSPHASRVHLAIADLLDYVADYPGVADGKTRSAVFCLTDGLDNVGGQDAEKRLRTALKKYAAMKGVFGLYWADLQVLNTWRRWLREDGFKNFQVEAEIVSMPRLPSFED